jgi:hypothetical protein
MAHRRPVLDKIDKYMPEINNTEKSESSQAITWAIPLVYGVAQTKEINAVPHEPQTPPLTGPSSNPGAQDALTGPPPTRHPEALY